MRWRGLNESGPRRERLTEEEQQAEAEKNRVVPVVDESSEVVGMLADRDVSMAAYMQGRTFTVRIKDQICQEVAKRMWSIFLSRSTHGRVRSSPE